MRPSTFGERYRRSLEDLPEERTDIIFGSKVTDTAIEKLAVEKVIVLRQFFNDSTTRAVSENARQWLLLHAPIRLGRRALDLAMPTANLPDFAKRQPLHPSIDFKPFLNDQVVEAINQIESLNASLYRQPVLNSIYGPKPRPLTNFQFNNTPRRKWFPVHQDYFGLEGFNFAVQTTDTLWHVQPSLTDPEATDYTFMTRPNDLVILRERAEPLADDSKLVIGRGFNVFESDGSVVHTGLNLASHTRNNMNVFRIEKLDQ